MARRRLDPGLIALAGAVGLPHRIAPAPVWRLAPTPASASPPVPAIAPPVVPLPIVPPPAVVNPEGERKAHAGTDGPRPVRRRAPMENRPLSPAPAIAPAPRGGVRPTDEQAAIVAAARGLRPGDALRIVAFAGAGKTTTLKMVAREAGLGRGLYVAFNKAIAADARRSFPPGVDCRTMHSVAWRAFGLRDDEIDRGALGAQAVHAALGGPWLPRDACGLTEHAQARLVGRTVALYCQSADREIGAGHIEAVLDEGVYRVPERVPEDGADAAAHRLAMERRAAVGRLLTRRAPALWQRLGKWREHRGAKIGHDGYLKAFEVDAELVRRSLRGFDFLMLDEAQDLNPVMRSIAEQAGVRLIAVGDPWQQVYTWRGAEDALELLPGRRLYLSQSFRFGEAIAAVARRILDSKPVHRPPVALRGSDRPGRVVEGKRARVTLCRSNAGVLSGAIAAAHGGQRPHVVGGIRELAAEVREAQALYEGRVQDVPETSPFRRFATWQELCEEAEQTGDVAMERLIQSVEEGIARDLVVLERMHAPAEEAADEVFSTAHRAKGREWPEVDLHEDFPDIDRLTRRYGAAQRSGRPADLRAALEEWHVLYVAATRAIDTLVLPQRLHDWLGGAA